MNKTKKQTSVSQALKFMRFFQPQSLLGLFMIALLIQSNFMFVNFKITENYKVKALVYVFNICIFFLLTRFIPTNLFEFLFPTPELSQYESKEEMSKNRYFIELINSIAFLNKIFTDTGSVIQHINMLTLSGLFTIFFASLIILRRFTMFYVLHTSLSFLFIFACFIGFRIVNRS